MTSALTSAVRAEPVPTERAPATFAREELKQLKLRSCDLSLFRTAACYDVTDRDDRIRSADELATFFFRVTHALAPALFIEAGAKDAGSSRRASRALPDSRVVAFEANPYTYQRFKSRRRNDPKVEYLNLALGDVAGPVTFNVLQNEDGRPQADGRGSMMAHGSTFPESSRQVTVQATTLDEFFAGYEFDSCAVWMDVEGATGKVFSGGREVLRRAAVLMIEVEDRPFWEEAWTQPEVASFLYDLGMLPVARDFQSRYQYNIVFVRESLLDHPEVRRRLVEHASLAATRRTVPPAPDPATSPRMAGPAGPAPRPAWRRVVRAVLPSVLRQHRTVPVAAGGTEPAAGG